MSHEEWLLGLKVQLQGDKAGQETSLLRAEVTAHVKITALALCNVWAHLGPFIRSPEVPSAHCGPAALWASGGSSPCPSGTYNPQGPMGEVTGDK